MGGLDASNTAEMDFDLTLVDDAEVVVALSGELDITNIEKLASAVSQALARNPDRLVVDLSRLRFADSSGIALWVNWSTRVDDIELRQPSPLLRKVIGSMGLSRTLHVTP
jgi:anti-anti-sigma factor